MPSKKSTVALRIDEQTYDNLTKLSELSGEPRSRIVCEFLEPLFQSLPGIVEALYEAETKRATAQQARDRVLSAVTEALARPSCSVPPHEVETVVRAARTYVLTVAGTSAQAGTPRSGVRPS